MQGEANSHFFEVYTCVCVLLNCSKQVLFYGTLVNMNFVIIVEVIKITFSMSWLIYYGLKILGRFKAVCKRNMYDSCASEIL